MEINLSGDSSGKRMDLVPLARGPLRVGWPRYVGLPPPHFAISDTGLCAVFKHFAPVEDSKSW